MQPRETWLQADLRKPAQVQALRGVMFSQDNQGDLVGVEVYDGGAPVALSGSVMGYIVKDNGETVGVTGQCAENRAWIVLPANAYDVVGMLHIAIQWKESSADTSPALTLGMCAVYVQRTQTGDIVTPEYRILDVAAILQMISDVTAATTAANTAAGNANAKATLADTAAENANTKATLADQKATLANNAATAANAAAAAAPTVLTATTQYKVADSGSTIPSAWDNDPPATVPQGKWLWIKQTLAWDNGQTSTLYTKTYQGRDGSGTVSSVSVGSNTPTYADSNNNVALPIDAAPTQNSSALLTSGAVYTAVEAVTSITVDMGTISSLPITKTATGVTADMTVDSWEIGTPSAFRSDLTVVTATGSVTVNGSISGSSTLKIKLSKTTNVTGEEVAAE
jgi:hypothetical protein